MDYLANFRERLSELMFEARLNATQLGKIIGVDSSAVWHWKQKNNNVSLPNALAIVEHFGCSLEFIFGRSEKVIDFMPHSALPFYERLRDIMAKNKVSRYRICIDLKMSNGNFTQWKRGVMPKIQNFISIADYLGVTLDYLIGRER